jgi:hypothetical protein
MARRTPEESLRYWGAIVRDQEVSGMSIRNLCERRKSV